MTNCGSLSRIRVEDWSDEDAALVEAWVTGQSKEVPPIITKEMERFKI